MRNLWLYYNGIRAHVAKKRMTFLQRNIFSPHNFSVWRPFLVIMFPGLEAPDLLLRKCLKSKVYVTRPHTIQELKSAFGSELEQSMLG